MNFNKRDKRKNDTTLRLLLNKEMKRTKNTIKVQNYFKSLRTININKHDNNNLHFTLQGKDVLIFNSASKFDLLNYNLIKQAAGGGQNIKKSNEKYSGNNFYKNLGKN